MDNVHSSFTSDSPNWRPPKCPSTNEQINKLWNMCNGTPQAATWMDFNIRMLSDRQKGVDTFKILENENEVTRHHWMPGDRVRVRRRD